MFASEMSVDRFGIGDQTSRINGTSNFADCVFALSLHVAY
jgi:hypothetical protein